MFILVSCPRYNFHYSELIPGRVTEGHEDLFLVSSPSVQRWWNGTKFMQVMEQPHRTKSPQRRAFFVPVRGALSALGAVTVLAVFWVTELKRDPRAPHVSVVETLLCDLLLGHDTSSVLTQAWSCLMETP
jgi:hypothetical protein